MPLNHYKVLGVPPNASVEEIERSFRRLARRLHPDLNGGSGAAVERMKDLNVARSTLTNPAARASYDEVLRREELAKAPPPVRPIVPPAPEHRPPGSPQTAAPRTAATGPRPRAGPPPASSKARDRTAPPSAAPPEIGHSASLTRIFWYCLAAAISLVIVMALILFHDAF